MKLKKVQVAKPVKVLTLLRSFNPLWLVGIVALTVVIYFNSLNNQFTNWDDDKYITANNDIRTLHGDSVIYTVKKAFTTYEVGNYHPLTTLSYCFEYTLFALNPLPYHITNLLIHLFNTTLVFGFIWLLTRQQLVALITALLFAIHPLHVESVAWVSERKDVLYAFFYLAALCMYLLYLKADRRKYFFYATTFLLFGLALLSKGMAASLPLVFFIIDFFLGRKLTVKTTLEKLPFFVLSLIFGYVAIIAQGSAMHPDIGYYTPFERVLLTCYALLLYWEKFLTPFNLSSFYTYPDKTDGKYPLMIYIAPAIVLLILFLVYKSKRSGKDIWFGFGFFFCTIALVLQIVPVGGAIISDRYTYLPYIGLFFILGRWFANLWENKYEKLQGLKVPTAIMLAFFVLIFSFLAAQRSEVWHDSIKLWSNVIEQNTGNRDVFFARGLAYDEAGQTELAIIDYTSAIQLNPGKASSYFVRANCFFHLHKYPEAIRDYFAGLALEPGNAEAYSNRGSSYSFIGKYEQALRDFDSAIVYYPNRAEVFNNRGFVLTTLKRYNEAIPDYDKALRLKKDYFEAWTGRASAYLQLHNFDRAISDYTMAIQLDSANATTEYNNRAVAYFSINKFQLAMADAIKAKQMGYPVDSGFMMMLKRQYGNF